MAIDTTVKFDGDARGAVAAGNRAEAALRGASATAASMAKGILAGGAALAAIAAPMAILGAGVRALSASVGDYVSRNQELADVTNGAKLAIKEATDSMLSQVLTTELVSTVAGTATEIVQGLAGAFTLGEGSSKKLAEALAGGLVTAARAVVGALRFAVNIWQTGKLALIALEAAVYAQTAAFAGLGVVIAEVVLRATSMLLDKFGELARSLAPFASMLDERLGNALQTAAGFTDGLSAATTELADSAKQLRIEMEGNARRALEGYGEEVAANLAQTDALNQSFDAMQTALDGVQTRIESGAVAQAALGRATRETTGAIAAQAAVVLKSNKDAEEAAFNAARQALIDAEAARVASGVSKVKTEAMEIAAIELERIRVVQEAEAAALQKRQEAYSKWGGIATNALADVASGQVDVAAAAREAIGSTLEALAMEAYGRAAILAASGNFAGAAAMVAAGIAASASARALGGVTTSAQGNAPVATNTVSNTTNRSVTIQAGVMTNDMAAEIAGLVTEADRRGLL